MTSDFTPIKINNKEYMVPNGTTILQACIMNGIEIPHFCYHEQLSIAGNCRMCLVKVSGSPKPVASCAMPALPNMEIWTDTVEVKQIRENVMELLLANHPLDCPICDQGGECDLQDQSVKYGNDRGRFSETKRAVEDKNMGPLVKTVMTRCIHCTRCVRFSNEVSGTFDLGTTGRGGYTEISSYISSFMKTELSGNLVDICPVGALTSKPYAFRARPWELKKTTNIDMFESLGTYINVETRGNDIMRITPSYSALDTEGWISDKTRFSFDSITRQRILFPLLKRKDLKKDTWKNCILKFSLYLSSLKSLDLHASNFLSYEESSHLKKMLHAYGYSSFASGSYDFRSNFMGNSINFNTDIDSSQTIYMLFTAIKQKMPLLNVMLKNRKNKRVIFLNPQLDANIKGRQGGNAASHFIKILEGRSYMSLFLEKKSVLITDSPDLFQLSSILNNCTSRKPLSKLKCLFIESRLNDVNTMDNGYRSGSFIRPLKQRYSSLGFFINSKDSSKNISKINVYLGFHGTSFAGTSNIIIPYVHPYEKESLYIDSLCRHRKSQRTLASPLKLVSNHVVFDALCYKINKRCSYLDPIASPKVTVQCPNPDGMRYNSTSPSVFGMGRLLYNSMHNYYIESIMTEYSSTMLKCSKYLLKKEHI